MKVNIAKRTKAVISRENCRFIVRAELLYMKLEKVIAGERKWPRLARNNFFAHQQFSQINVPLEAHAKFN